MNKKTLVLVLALAIILILACCSAFGGNKTEAPETTAAAETTEATETTEETSAVPTQSYELPEGEGVENVSDDPADPEAEETKAPQEMKSAEATTAPTNPDPKEEPSATEAAGSTGCGCAYEAYLKMSAAEQEAYMNSYASPLDFIEWCKAAEAEHESHNSVTNVVGGDLDIGDFIDGND